MLKQLVMFHETEGVTLEDPSNFNDSEKIFHTVHNMVPMF